MIPNLRSPYLAHGIGLNICVEYINDTELIENCQSFVDSSCEYDDPAAIDILIVSQNVSPNCAQNSGRASSIPGDRGYGFWTLDGFVIKHELAHLLGLRHLNTDFGCFLRDGNNDIVFVNGIAQTTGAGDEVADTPPAREITVNSAGQFLGYLSCGVQPCIDCEPDWTLYADECGIPFSQDHDIENVFYNNIMSSVQAVNGCTEPTDEFTSGQATRMRGFLNTSMSRFTTGSPETCPFSSFIATDVTTPSFWQGIIELNQSITISSDLTIEGGNLIAQELGEIIVAPGGSLTVINSDLSTAECNTLWSGIVIESGGVLDVFDSKISNAQIGLDIKSTSVYTNLLEISECGLAINIDGVGNVTDDPDQSNELQLNNVTLFSPAKVNNSTTYFMGCHFEDDLTCDASAIFVFPSAIAPNRRCMFSQSKIIYNSGPRLMIDYTSFNVDQGPAVQVNQCGFFTTCQSYFNFFLGGAIKCYDVDKLDVFLNVFDGSNLSNAIDLITGEYGSSSNGDQAPFSFIRDNIFGGNVVDINTQTDTDDLNIFCNYHEEYGTAWQIGGYLKNQGTPTLSAQNVFKTSDAATDIDNNAAEFTYHYLSSEEYPKNNNNVDLSEILTHQGGVCENDNIGKLQDEWDDYFQCYNDAPPGQESYVVCCDCCFDPPEPTFYEGLGVDNVDGRQRTESIDIELLVNPNPANEYVYVSGVPKFSVVRIMDLTGKEVFSIETKEARQLEIKLLNFTSGLYKILITDTNNNIVNQTSFVKK